MSRDFVTKEVETIMKDSGYEYPQNVAMASAWIAGNLKGVNLKIYDVEKSTSLSDYFVLASAGNHVQSKSMAELIVSQMKKYDVQALSVEGKEDADWILIDLGEVIVHLFLESTRDIYQLETLWGENPQLEIPHSYYFSSPEESESEGDSVGKSYF